MCFTDFVNRFGSRSKAIMLWVPVAVTNARQPHFISISQLQA